MSATVEHGMPYAAQTRMLRAVQVTGGAVLSGTVPVDGSKNACLPLLAAAAVTHRDIELSQVPECRDVEVMLELLAEAGWLTESRSTGVRIAPGAFGESQPELADAAAIRASYYLVPALLSVFGSAELPWPGGCTIGQRDMDLHFAVYRAFGDRVDTGERGYRVTAGTTTAGPIRVDLPYRSRGATIAAALRAVAYAQHLMLTRPNLAPETTGMLDALAGAGFAVSYDEHRLLIQPNPCSLVPLAWAVPGDKVEAGTLACAIAATGGHGLITGVRVGDLGALRIAMRQLGVPTFAEGEALRIGASSTVAPIGVRAEATLDPGGLDADFEPPLMALALSRPGTHTFADAINPGRHGNLLPQLEELGATITAITPTRAELTGPQALTGAEVTATDIRTGAALLIAALTARGTTIVSGLEQLRRGHADLPAKLAALGARIGQVS